MHGTHSISPELRLFVSSTFHDLQGERDHLAKHVFPEVRRFCRSRGVEFTEIDLRWGVTEEEASMGRVVRTCLEEIDRCRPYFIGILGSRYGWVPKLHELQKDYELLQRYPWIEEAGVDELSITEMECLYGVVHDPAAAAGAFIYCREPEGPDDGIDAGELEKVRALRGALESSGRPVRTFSDPVDLGRKVREDLLAVIERDWPTDRLPSVHDVERRNHAAYAAQRRRAYIARIAYLRLLNEHAVGDGPPLVVTGEPGIGKSSQLAYWGGNFRRRNPSIFFFEHYVEAASGGSQGEMILERLVAEIGERFGREPRPAGTGTIARELPHLLEGLAGPIVIVIDGLDRLDEASRRLRWLPPSLPPNVRLILSTSLLPTDVQEPVELSVLRERGCRELPIALLEREEREAIAVRFLGEYRKGLSAAQLRTIADDPKCSLPIFLRTVLEELRLSGSFENLDARIDHYLACRDTDDLFRLVLERLEGDYGADAVRNVLTSLRAARHGLSETELIEITGIGRTALSTLLIALEYHLSQIDGLIAFSHEYLRRAVSRRYLSGDGSRREAHLRLARYFREQPLDERKADELPWQLREGKEWNGLMEAVSDIDMFRILYTKGGQHELLRYWVALGKGYDLTTAYCERLRLYEETHPEGGELADTVNQIGELIYWSGGTAAAEKLFRRALSLRERFFGPDHPSTGESLDNLASTMLLRGACEEAEPLFRRAVEVKSGALGPSHHETILSLTHLALTLQKRGMYDGAETLLRRALELRAKEYGDDDPEAVAALARLAEVLTLRGSREESELHLRKVVAIRERTLGRERTETADGLSNLAILLMSRRRYQEAESLLRRAHGIYEISLGSDHRKTNTSRINLGRTLWEMGMTEEGEGFIRRAVEACLRTLPEEDSMRGSSLFQLGRILAEQGEREVALPLLGRAVAIMEKSFGEDAPNTSFFRVHFARVLIALRRPEEAEILLLRAVASFDSLPPSRELSHEEKLWKRSALFNLAALFVEMNRPDEALPISLRAREMLAAADPDDPPGAVEIEALMKKIAS